MKKQLTSEKKMKKRLASEKGFTLLEILVVLTIMGFLVAMVAPRLAMVGGDAVDTVCDTNQNRMVTYLATYYQKTDGSLPNNLTNLVTQKATDDIVVPEISDGDPEDGDMGVLSNEFGLRNNFKAHVLNAAEAAELAGLGIENVFNLNDPEAADVDAPFMDPETIESGVTVAMVGMGAGDATADLSVATNNDVEGTATAVEEHSWGEPAWLGRIVLGLGPECGLVTDGIISNAAHCPGGLQNDDNCTYNDYNLVVPRLAATVDRLPAGGIFGASNETTAVAYADGDLDFGAAGATPYNYVANADHLMKRTVKLTAQEGWEYQTQCPEGHVYPESHDFWAIDLNGNKTIEP